MLRSRLSRKYSVGLKIEAYLADYIQHRYPWDTCHQRVLIPPSSDLYHCLYENLRVPRSDTRICEPNIWIALPSPGYVANGYWKDTQRFCALSERGERLVAQCIRRQFNFEFHQVLIENDENGRPQLMKDVIHAFIKKYSLSISEEALIKNYQRFRKKFYPKTPRCYSCNAKKA